MSLAPYPFSALVGSSSGSAAIGHGLDDLTAALLLNAVHPAIGGVLVRGEKGTAKSTAVRGLAALLPEVDVVEGCAFSCDPAAPDPACPDGPHEGADATTRPVRLVELPVGASEDRLAGSLDLERALTEGRRAFEPGLLARAHRGVLYVDEVNLLGDHLVDLLLDAAAMGTNIVEREGVSVRHAARFQLVGTMNPEEGELRPQLLDRFGLTVEVRASRDVAERAEVVRRRLAYEADPAGFAARWVEADAATAARVRAARARLPQVVLGESALRAVVAVCAAFDVDGLRADIVTAKTATAIAAWDDRTEVTVADVRAAALLSLPHRRRRGPFESPGIDEAELDAALDCLGDPEPPEGGPDGPGAGPGPQGGPGGPADGQGSPDGGAGQPVRSSAEGGDGGDGSSDGRAEMAAQPPGEGDRPGGSSGSSDGRAEMPARPSEEREGGGSAAPTTLPVGATFAPILLEVQGTGAGAQGRRSPAESTSGRHAGDRVPRGRVTDLSLGATLRAAAPHQGGRGRDGAGLVVRRADLREKVREGREGNLVLFCVDASGSMAARRRMEAVKGAVLSLLLDAYQRRDRIGLVTFRGEGAELALPPTGSVDRAARLLADLPTGGRTPIATGLERAAQVLGGEAVRDPRRRPLLVVLTDGRATAAGGIEGAERAAAGLAARRVPSIVVDTEDAAVRLGLAGRLAAALGAPWLRLEDLAAGSIAGVVRAATAPTPRRAA
jgi:magnesium chelatase subunit D